MTMTVQPGRRDGLQITDAQTAYGGYAGRAWPAHENLATEIIEIGSLGVASPPIA